METSKFEPQSLSCSCSMPDRRYSVTSGLTAIFSTLGIVYVTHGLLWAECTVPYVFVGTFPLVLIYKLSKFCENPTVNDDLSLVVNIALFVFLWMSYNSHVFQMLFSLATGPVLLLSILTPDALKINDPDAMSSIYLHWAPAIVLFCVQWYSPYSYWPLYWWRDNFNIMSLPDFNIVWCYALPMTFILFYTLMFWLFSKLVVERHFKTVPVYSILQTQVYREEHTPSRMPWNDVLTYFAVKCTEGLVSLLLPLIVYSHYGLHCFTFFLLFLYVTWKGGCATGLNKSWG